MKSRLLKADSDSKQGNAVNVSIVFEGAHCGALLTHRLEAYPALQYNSLVRACIGILARAPDTAGRLRIGISFVHEHGHNVR